MNNKKIFLLLILISATIISCESYLEEKVISGVSYDFFETKTGIENAVNGTYMTMRWYVGNERYYCLTEYGVDYVWEGADGSKKDAFNKYSSQLNSGEILLYQFWVNNYNGINRANTALMYLPKISNMPEEEKRSIEGELKFMRAYFYFDLVQHFGAIPLILEGNVSEIITDFQRAPVSAIYEAIISDLTFAYNVLPDATRQAQRGKATKWAAAHLLAKIYLTRGSAKIDQRGQQASDMQNALKYAKTVIESGRFSLEEDYALTFDIDQQKSSSETIFGIEFTQDILFNGEGNRMHLYWIPTYEILPGLQRDLKQGRSWKRVRPTPHFLTHLFDNLNDSRIYKMFNWVFYANNESSIPVWNDKYYYIDEKGKTTDELLYEPPSKLVGQRKFSIGDTAVYLILKSFGAKNDRGIVVDVEKDKEMQLNIAKSAYTLIPIDNNTNHFFPCLRKWLDPKRPDMNTEPGSRNFVRMRLAETYLIAAEAAGRNGDMETAAEYINVVRRRAAYKQGEEKPGQWLTIEGGDPSKLLDSTEEAMMITSKDISADFINFMLDERSREMFGENNRWEDLVRTETLIERVKKYNPDAAVNIKDFHKLRPIPQQHIDRLSPQPSVDKAQNEGYY